MNKINHITKVTNQRFLNMYQLDVTHKTGKKSQYYVASRAEETKDLKLITKQNKPDGVIIYSLYGEAKDKVVLVRQYRYSLDDYIYEFPAGLVDSNESFQEAAIRELREETGLILTPLSAPSAYMKPFFTTVGMTDESCATVFGYANGTPSELYQEESETMQIVLADRKEAARILSEENTAIMCAYMLMHFISSTPSKTFDFLKV